MMFFTGGFYLAFEAKVKAAFTGGEVVRGTKSGWLFFDELVRVS